MDLASAAGFKGMLATSSLMDAIAALRRVKGTSERRTELEEKLRKIQGTVFDDLGQIGTSFDISELVERARASVSDMTLMNALAQFACLSKSPSPEDLKKEAVRQAEENPLSTVFASEFLDDEGKVVSRSPGMGLGKEPDEIGLQHQIEQHEKIRRQLDVAGAIEPVRRVIQSEHPLEAQDFHILVQFSPLVPADHEEIFAQGFSAMFRGDYVAALHLLVPQLENSMRYLLKQQGVGTSKIKSDLLQTSITISTMLDVEQFRNDVVGIFGEDITAEIERIFDFDGGPKIRHLLAHGLLSSGACSSDDAVYACWFIFRLACLPLLTISNWQKVSDAYVEAGY